jgi:hypothetical protein
MARENHRNDPEQSKLPERMAAQTYFIHGASEWKSSFIKKTRAMSEIEINGKGTRAVTAAAACCSLLS